MERRKFIKDSCALCMAVGTGIFASSLLNSCSTIPLYKAKSIDKKIKVPLTQFEKHNYIIVRPLDFNFDITVFKDNNSQFRSIVMECTHADNPLQFTGKEFHCSLHGSVFNSAGDVKKGPAEKKLKTLLTEVENNEVVIHLIR
jgi:Rieske Fe-S protein